MNRQPIACGVLLLLLGVNGVLWSQSRPTPTRPASPPPTTVPYQPRPVTREEFRLQPAVVDGAGGPPDSFRPDSAVTSDSPAPSTDQDPIGSTAPPGYAFNNLVPVTDDELFEQKVRAFAEQVNQRIQHSEKGPASRDLELQRALDRYFARARIQQAIKVLQAVIEANPKSEEAAKAAGAIRLLNTPSASRDANVVNDVITRPDGEARILPKAK